MKASISLSHVMFRWWTKAVVTEHSFSSSKCTYLLKTCTPTWIVLRHATEWTRGFSFYVRQHWEGRICKMTRQKFVSFLHLTAVKKHHTLFQGPWTEEGKITYSVACVLVRGRNGSREEAVCLKIGRTELDFSFNWASLKNWTHLWLFKAIWLDLDTRS